VNYKKRVSLVASGAGGVQVPVVDSGRINGEDQDTDVVPGAVVEKGGNVDAKHRKKRKKR
ncbi:MAG: hypothetical protein ACM3UW_07780, partial [Bacillota bacterium]